MLRSALALAALLIAACSSPASPPPTADAGPAAKGLAAASRCSTESLSHQAVGYVQCECHENGGTVNLLFTCGQGLSPNTVAAESECYSTDDANAVERTPGPDRVRCTGTGTVCGRIYCVPPQ